VSISEWRLSTRFIRIEGLWFRSIDPATQYRQGAPSISALYAEMGGNYSVFGSALYRINQVKWLFPQEKATFHAVPTLTSETKTL
jgi:hypothetical protein